MVVSGGTGKRTLLCRHLAVTSSCSSAPPQPSPSSSTSSSSCSSSCFFCLLSCVSTWDFLPDFWILVSFQCIILMGALKMMNNYGQPRMLPSTNFSRITLFSPLDLNIWPGTNKDESGLIWASAFFSSQPFSRFAAPEYSMPAAFQPHNLGKGADGGGWAVTCRDRLQVREWITTVLLVHTWTLEFPTSTPTPNFICQSVFC